MKQRVGAEMNIFQSNFEKQQFNDKTHVENKAEITFSQLPNYNLVSDTRRDEISSLIDNNINQNDQTIIRSPSLNLNNLEKSQFSKIIYPLENVNSCYEKSEYQDTENVTHTEKDSTNLIGQNLPSYIQRKSNQTRSIFLSQVTKTPGSRQKQHMKTLISYKSNQSTSSYSKFLSFMLLNKIRKKMIYFQKNFTQFGRNKAIQENKNSLRQIINDKGDYFMNTNKKLIVKIFIKIFNFFRCFKQNKNNSSLCCYMIVPNSLINLLTLILFCFLNILFYFLLSVIIIFEGYKQYEHVIVKIIVSTWFLEIMVQLNTKIYKRTNLISDRGKVLVQYIKKRAIFDLIPLAVTLTLPEDFIWRKICQGVAFLKLKNVLNDINKMQKLLCMSVKNYYLVQLFNLIFKVLVISHIIACLWYLVGQIELHFLNYEQTWYDNSLGSDYVWWKLYLESIYWSLTLLTTGSNNGNSIPQMLFISIVMLFTTIVFGYMLNTTGIILSQLDEKDENKRIDLNILNEYMRQNNISKSLQGRVNLDLEYYYLHNLKKDSEQKQEVLRKISPNLQDLLKLEYCKKASEKIHFIYNKFSKETVHDMVLEFQEEFFSPNQMILYEKQVNDQCLVCIVQGSVEIMQSIEGDTKNKKQVQVLKAGDLVGQINFFTGLGYDYSVRSLEFTKILKISRDKFIEIVQKRRDDYEIFCQIRDSQQFSQEYQYLKYKCPFCQNSSHFSTECNLIHLEKYNYPFKIKFEQNNIQQRQKFERKKDIVNSYQIRQQIEKQIQKFAWEAKYTQKMDQIIHNKTKRLMSADSDLDSDNSDGSSLQMMSSQLSSDNTEFEQSPNEAQRVRKESYFDQNNFLRRLNANQHLKKKKLEHNEKETINIYGGSTDNKLIVDQIKQPIYKNKRESILVKPDNINKRNSIYFQDLNIVKNSANESHVKRNSFLIDDSNLLRYSKNRVNILFSENKPRRSNSMNVKDESTPASPIEKSKNSHANNNENLNFTKKIDLQKSKINFNIKKSQLLNKQHTLYDDEQKEKKKCLFLHDFDIMKNWDIYFPHGNVKNILQKQNKFIRKKQKQQRMQSEKRYKNL